MHERGKSTKQGDSFPDNRRKNKNGQALSKADEILIEDNEISNDQDDLELLDCIEQLNQNINKTNEDPEAKQFAELTQ